MSHTFRIPFNKPYLHGKELTYISEAVASGKICGDGLFTKKCHDFFEKKYLFPKALLTTSCTDALEMCALLLDIKPGDEVIAPSYTFVSTVNAFVLRGAKIIFADSQELNPNIDHTQLESLITKKTKAIIVVHYAGIACEMDHIMALAYKYGLYVVEDAAQAIDSYYKKRLLGSIGHMSTFSFHETKNIICGEGGLWVGNDVKYHQRAEIIREKGTNRSSFFRGEVDKYGWVDIGSSFLPTDIVAAYLYAQLEALDSIQEKRIKLWNLYYECLEKLAGEYGIQLPHIPSFGTNNAHMFYMICVDFEQREKLINELKKSEILSTFHYQPLHKSMYFKDKYTGLDLPNAERYGNSLLRLPMYYELKEEDVIYICSNIKNILQKY